MPPRGEIPSRYKGTGLNLTYSWLSLLCVVALLFFAGWGFVFLFCEPEPNNFERAVFFGLLFLIFLETVNAGWYRVED
jgi:hypothetical protein